MELTPEQIEMCDDFEVEPIPCEEMVAAAVSTLSLTPLFGHRVPMEGNETVSWFIYGGEGSDASDFYQLMSVHDLIQAAPGVIPFLALPAPSSFILDEPNDYEQVNVGPGAPA